ncbi:DUF2778 domain-containing protein [Trinickia sp. LjRoot230]|uniref:tlde1 domain-containing protein n=1 Tax=Trinickia sp. LjRoot230 TaxID=3342288 RepID=UPI003ECE9D8B
MPAACTFSLNSQKTSVLSCPGAGLFSAFSGTSTGHDNPKAVAQPDIGPLPPGRYFIVDRQSGGRAGWIRDLQRGERAPDRLPKRDAAVSQARY